jgi:hypothetical protein
MAARNARKASPETRGGPVKYDSGVIGSTGLRQYGGVVTEEFLKELHGARGARVYREMADNDPVCGAVLFAITMLLRRATWSWTAPDQSTEAEKAKEFAESVFSDMTTPMTAIIDEVCSMFTYGYAPMEITWKKRNGPGGDSTGRSKFTDGKIGIREIRLRAQPTVSRWQIDDDDGTIDGLWQQPIAGPLVFIPIEKMLLFRTTTVRNNPEGRSCLRSAYRPWYFKKRIEEIEGVGVERDLAGMPMVKLPGRMLDPNASPEDKAVAQAYIKMLKRVRADQQTGIMMPSDRDANGNALFEFSLLSTAGSRTFDTTGIVDRYDRRIATSVLADFIFLGQSAVGSFALSSDKTALFATAIGAFLQDIADVINDHLLPRLWDLNAFDPDIMPKLVPGDVETPNLAELAAYITSLAGAGVPLFPDRELENHLRSLAGLPEAPEDSGIDVDTPALPTTGPYAVHPTAVEGMEAANAALANGGAEEEPKGKAEKRQPQRKRAGRRSGPRASSSSKTAST